MFFHKIGEQMALQLGHNLMEVQRRNVAFHRFIFMIEGLKSMFFMKTLQEKKFI